MLTHFSELKYRILYIFFSFIITFFCCYIYSMQLVFLLTKPFLNLYSNNLFGYEFLVTHITEIFNILINVSLFVTLYIIIIYSIFQFWLFLIPGLYNFEKKLFIKYYFIANFFVFLTFYLIYNYLLFYIFKFFLNYETFFLQKNFSLVFEGKFNDYIFLSYNLLIYLTFFIQLPIWILFLFKISGLNLNKYIIFRKFIYVGFLIFATLISPPDIISQLVICFILVLIYESFILFSKFISYF